MKYKYEEAVRLMEEGEIGIAREAWVVDHAYRIWLQLHDGVIRQRTAHKDRKWVPEANGIHMEADDWVVVDLCVQTNA